MSTDFADWIRGVTTVTGSLPPMTDFPDWTIAVQEAGGGGGGAYASLTGAGQTTTPGDLDQEGGFTVNDTAGDGINLNSSSSGFGVIGINNQSTNGEIFIQNTGTNGTSLDDFGGGGIGVVASGGGGVTVSGDAGISASTASNGSIGIKLHDTGTSPIEISQAPTGGTSGGISITDTTTSSGAAGIHIGTNGAPILIGAGQLSFVGTVTIQNAAAFKVAFYGHAGSAQQTIGGSRGGNAALAALLTALANLGLIVDSTTP